MPGRTGAPRGCERLIEEDHIQSYLREHGENVALVLWPGVQYASGQVFDLGRIAESAREC